MYHKTIRRRGILQHGGKIADALYFPNQVLPVRADLFSRVAWQLRTRARVQVYAWMPVLAFRLPAGHPLAARTVTALATTTFADVTGLLAASALAVIGLFVIPLRRAQAKSAMRAKIEAMRQQLVGTLTTQFDRRGGRRVARGRASLATPLFTRPSSLRR